MKPPAPVTHTVLRPEADEQSTGILALSLREICLPNYLIGLVGKGDHREEKRSVFVMEETIGTG
jgi:hypothetical protein